MGLAIDWQWALMFRHSFSVERYIVFVFVFSRWSDSRIVIYWASSCYRKSDWLSISQLIYPICYSYAAAGGRGTRKSGRTKSMCKTLSATFSQIWWQQVVSSHFTVCKSREGLFGWHVSTKATHLCQWNEISYVPLKCKALEQIRLTLIATHFDTRSLVFQSGVPFYVLCAHFEHNHASDPFLMMFLCIN